MIARAESIFELQHPHIGTVGATAITTVTSWYIRRILSDGGSRFIPVLSVLPVLLKLRPSASY